MRIKITDIGQSDNFYRYKDNFIGQMGEVMSLAISSEVSPKWMSGTVKFDPPIEFEYRKTKSLEKVGPLKQAYLHQFQYEKV